MHVTITCIICWVGFDCKAKFSSFTSICSDETVTFYNINISYKIISIELILHKLLVLFVQLGLIVM